MKSKTLVPAEKGQPFRSEEYDFSRVQDDDLEACCYYEYARESQSIRKQVRRIQSYFDSKNESGALPKWWGAEDHKYFLLGTHKGFPDTPWQLLNQKDRKNLRDQLNDLIKRMDLEMLSLKQFQSPEEAMSFLFGRGSGTARTGIFYIDTAHDKKHICSEFKKWMNALYSEIDTTVRSGRQNSPRDSLNRLGALRLRKHCWTFGEAQALVKAIPRVLDNDIGMSYADHRSWNRACDGAVDRFRSILGVPSAEFPICYTKDWQKL
jgi:hypothetical protein